MVCLGNICRSPLAEGILRSKTSKFSNFEVASSGTAAWHVGKSPDKRSVDVALKHGIDISKFRASQFRKSDFDTFDKILVMDTSNYKDVLSLAPNQKAKEKVQLLLSLDTSSKEQEVPDPYYGGLDGFEKVFQMISKACDAFLLTQVSSK